MTFQEEVGLPRNWCSVDTVYRIAEPFGLNTQTALNSLILFDMNDGVFFNIVYAFSKGTNWKFFLTICDRDKAHGFVYDTTVIGDGLINFENEIQDVIRKYLENR
jgi:hypothetical protein